MPPTLFPDFAVAAARPRPRRPRRTTARLLAATLALAASVAGSTGSPASAAELEYVITTTADGGPGSLRAAVADANLAASGTDVVVFRLPTGTYDLTVCGVGEDDLDISGDLDITTAATITITATGPNVVVHQTCGGERVIDQRGSGFFTLSNITISGGSIVGPDPATPATGGGVRVVGDAHLSGATITGNTAAGAPATPLAPHGGAAFGGGVAVGGDLAAHHTTFANNRATGADGLDATPPSGTGGTGGPAGGGGAHAGAAVVFDHVTLLSNTATGGPGGSADARPGAGGDARGGGLAVALGGGGTASFTATTITNNEVRGGDSGGLLQAPPLPPGAYLPAGTATGGGAAVDAVLTATVTAADNRAIGGSGGMGVCAGFGGTCPSPATPGTGDGGALAVTGLPGSPATTILPSSFTNNQARSGDSFLFFFSQGGTPVGGAGSAARGGALWSGGNIEIVGSTFAENGATQGVGTPMPNGAAFGGAVASAGLITITGGSFTLNTATTGQGGAVATLDTLAVSGVAFIDNVATGGSGGAVLAQNLTATDSTFERNIGSGTGGGAIAAGADVTLTRTSVTNSTVITKFYGNPNGVSAGGGVLAGDDLVMTDSTVSGNSGSATFSQGILCRDCPINFRGGGVSAATVTTNAVTVSGNTASGPAGGPLNAPGPTGGGIFATNTASLTNTTVAGNNSNATYNDGPVVLVGSGVSAPVVALEQSTVANNLNASSVATATLTSHRSAALAAVGQSVCGTGTVAAASSSNVFSDASCGLAGVGDQQGPAPFLFGPVGDNGGPVPTMMPGSSSVLVDAIPPASCPVPVDARGVTRPQGPACDIGAVEVTAASDTGPTDLAVSFTAPPPSVTPGTEATWTLTVANHGPAGARPSVVVDLPAGVTVSSSSATDGGACGVSGSALNCVWDTTIASGSTTTVEVVGLIDSSVVDDVVWHATVSAPLALPPHTDDEADLSTPVTPSADVHLTVQFERSWDDAGHMQAGLVVELFNDGPSNARGTAADPIEIEFLPAPGVHGSGASIEGSFAPDANAFERVWIDLSLDPGLPVPPVVGTVILHSGAASDPEVSEQSISVAGTDLAVVASREGGVQTPGAPTKATVTVANWGPATVTDVVVSLYVSDAGLPTYVPSIGTVSEVGGIWGPSWQIPSLAPGATAVLHATVPDQGAYAGLSARVSSSAVDFNEENDVTRADLRLARHGTADLRVDRVKVYMAAPGQRVLRATITNHGISPAVGSPNDPITVRLLNTPEAHGIHVVTRAPGWRCVTPDEYFSACTSRFALAAGESVVIDFAVEGTYPDTQPRLGIEVSAALTIDPRAANNVKFVNARFAWPWAPPPLP